MELRKYQKASKSTEVKLGSDDVLKLDYLPNYMTGENLKLMDEARKADVEANSYESMQDVLSGQLALVIDKVDITIDGNPVPFGTLEEKKATLAQLSYQDLQRIDEKVRKEITAPLE